MRWIDFENKKPTDSFSGWVAWTDLQWDTWQDKSCLLLLEIMTLNEIALEQNQAGALEDARETIKARNDVVDSNSSHWGELRDWLLALSHGKCWFSEAKDIFSYWHVEHFRPKKEAKDDINCDENGKAITRDGYWWLAFDYSNYRICGSVGNSTKGGWFPLHKDSKCSTIDSQCEETEAAYLIDPTKQCDVALISFQEDGNAIPLEPDKEAWDWQRADVSIKRLGLNSYDKLPEARRTVAAELQLLMDRFFVEKSRYKPGVNELPRGTMGEIAKQITAYLDERRPLSAFARWFVKSRNDRFLSRLAA